MSRFISDCIIILVLGMALPLMGQGRKLDSARVDTVRKLPTGIRFAVEAIGPGKAFSGSEIRATEFAADTDFGKYFVTAEFGRSERSMTIPGGSYNNNGTYLRIGADVNFLRKDPDRNMFFLGARYARAIYDEEVSYLSTTEFGDQLKRVANNNISAGWLELTAGLKVRVWKIFWMGYTARMKFAPSTPSDSPMIPYEIPGYGLTFKKPWWGFSYYLMVRIPFRKGT